MSSLDATSPLTDYLDALDRRDVSARELVTSTFERIEELDGQVNAVVTTDVERAFEVASAIDDARARGDAVGALAGVPVTIKDALATAGIRSTGGAVELADHVPAVDATVVSRIRQAGAVVIGKTNVPRWSGDYQSYNEIFGTTNNPWDLARTPGGSSGGPAASVAMGFTGFEIGTDIGGSIRVPSSFCGIVGHKPSFGIVPTFGYLDNPRSHRNVADVNVFGPMARSVDDLEVLLGLIAGPNPDDAPAWRLDLPPERATEIDEFRVAAWIDDAFAPVDPAVSDVLSTALDALEGAGARIDRERRPSIDAATAAREGLRLISAATAISDTDEEYAADSAAGLELDHRQWDVLHRRRGEVRQRWSQFFETTDILLCPVIAVPAFAHVHCAEGPNWVHATIEEFGDIHYSELIAWSGLIGSAYLPVTATPVGFTAGGLPVGIQVVAPYLHDLTALAFARCIESVLGGYVPPPLART